MINQTYMEKLLKGIELVSYKRITEIAYTYIGLVTTMTKHYVSDGVPLIHNSNIKQNNFKFKKRTYLDYDFAKKNNSRSHKVGDVITVHTGDVGTSAVIGEELNGSLGFATIVSRIHDQSIVMSKFLSYFLNSNQCKCQICRMIKGDRNNLNLKDFNKLKIPIPPLEIQKEIVRILDTFTELTAELTAELTDRKKQYTYYRDQLLSFEEGEVEWKKLTEVCDYVDYRGKTPKKTSDGIFLVTAKNIRMGFIDYQASQEFISKDNYSLVMRRGLPEIGDVLITTEAPCGYVAQVDRKNIALAQRVIKYRSRDSSLLNSFLKHYLIGNQFQRKLHKAATGSTVKGIKGSKLHKLTIPIPSPEEQNRIVAILDKFDALSNSITVGLPREIELRKKQYEYYREMLLTFPKAEVSK